MMLVMVNFIHVWGRGGGKNPISISSVVQSDRMCPVVVGLRCLGCRYSSGIELTTVGTCHVGEGADGGQPAGDVRLTGTLLTGIRVLRDRSRNSPS